MVKNMSFASDIKRDLDLVFFADEALNCLLTRQSDSVHTLPSGFKCKIKTGLQRFTGEGYSANKWEITVKLSDRIVRGDLIQVLDDDGLVVEHYLVGEIAQRQGDVLIFAVDKQRIQAAENLLPPNALLLGGKALTMNGQFLVHGV